VYPIVPILNYKDRKRILVSLLLTFYFVTGYNSSFITFFL